MAQSLGGVTVTSGDRILPLFFVSPTQINFLLPADFPVGPAGLTLSASGQADLRAAFTVVRNAPGLFQQTVDGLSFALAVHEDGSTVSLAAPAKSGELLTVYGTGFGPTDRLRPAGFAIPAQPPFQVTDLVNVSIGDSEPANPLIPKLMISRFGGPNCCVSRGSEVSAATTVRAPTPRSDPNASAVTITR